MSKTDIFEWGSWRVTEDDSNEEKSGVEVGGCVNGSRIRKPVPPPEVLWKSFRGVLSKE